MRRASVRLVPLIAVLAAAFCAPPTAAAGTITTAFAPSADAYVSSAFPSTNYGTASVVRVASSGDRRRGFLRFVVSGLTAPVNGASLRIHAQTAHPAGFTVRRVNNTTWGETTISNGNAPSISSTVAGTVGAVTAGTWITVPLSGIVTGNGTYSLGLVGRGSSTTVLSLGSRESATAPSLQVQTTDSVAPALSVGSPAAGAWVGQDVVSIAGGAGTAAGDAPVVSVELFAGGVASGSPLQSWSAAVTAGSWSVSSGTLIDGTYTVRASQADQHGNLATRVVTFTVDTVTPVVSITAPADGETLVSALPVFSGQAGSTAGDEAAVTLEIYSGTQVAGAPVQSLVAGYPGIFLNGLPGGAWSLVAGALADGVYTARVVQRDAAGNSAGSGPVTFTIDTPDPALSVDSPAAGAWVGQDVVSIAGGAGTAAGDAPVVSVELFAGGVASGSPLQSWSAAVTAGSWSVSSGTLIDGTYTVRASQADQHGNLATRVVTFTVDTVAPVVSITAPSALATVSGPQTFSGAAGNAAGDEADVSLSVYADPEDPPVLTAVTQRIDGSWALAAGALPDGTYTARAVQRDAAGNTAQSAPVVFRAGKTFAEEVLADAPRGYWRLGETAGTTATDLGSAGNPGTYQGGVSRGQPGALSGDPDPSILTNGTSGNVSVTDPSGTALNPGTSDFTVELWMRTTVNNQQSVIGKQATSGAYWQLLVTNAASQLGKLRATFWDGASQRQAFSSVRVDDGIWHHVVVAFTRSTGIDIYVDGQRSSKPGGLATSIGNSAPMQIGKVTGYPYFSGSLDEVAVYSRALSQERVSAHLAAAQGPDVTAPTPTITGPASTTGDDRPTMAGRPGARPGDRTQLTVRLFAGSTADGDPLQSLTTNATAAGAWSVNAATALPDGTYTASVSQRDAAGNVGTASRTFAVRLPTGPPDYRAAVLASQPRGFWRLGEGGGAATGDETSQNNAGTLLGGIAPSVGAVVGDEDPGLAFDGVDDELTFGDPADGSLDLGTRDLTIEGWVKTSSSAQRALLGKQGSGGAYWQLLVAGGHPYTGRIRATFSDGTTTRQFYSPQRVDDGLWHHVAVTFRRGTGADMYVDGYRDFRASKLTGSLDNSAPLQVGRLGGYAPFLGGLDELAIYDRALSPAEVASHHAEGTRAEGTVPVASLQEPSPGASTTDGTPRFAGRLGTQRGDLPTAVVRIYEGPSATGDPLRSPEIVAGPGGDWSLEHSTALAPGTYTAHVEQSDTSGNTGISPSVTFTVEPVATPPGDAPALIAAGDIASCGSAQGHKQTAALLGELSGEIQTLGDNAYANGSAADFACFDQAWGPYKARIHPALGDHEYDTGSAAAYFAYFGAAAGDPGTGYYAYDIGAWRVVVLNPVCDVLPGGCDAGGAQETWLRSELASNPRQCTIAVISAPRFSSGEVHGNGYEYTDLWRALHDAGTDVVLSGDDHVYERFAPQAPDGRSDSVGGIRQFTVGTGGYYLYAFGPAQPLSEERRAGTHGLLRLTLRDGSYEWRFHAVAGSSYSDTGSSPCH